MLVFLSRTLSQHWQVSLLIYTGFFGDFIIFLSLSGTKSSETAILCLLSVLKFETVSTPLTVWIVFCRVDMCASVHVCGHTEYMCVCVCVHTYAHLEQYSLTLVLCILCSLSFLMESLQGQKRFHFFCIYFYLSLPSALPLRMPAGHR